MLDRKLRTGMNAVHNHFVQSGFSSTTATMFSVIIFSVICVWHLFRFEREAAAVNSELRVKQLQHALRKAEQKHTDLKKVCYFHKSKKKTCEKFYLIKEGKFSVGMVRVVTCSLL